MAAIASTAVSNYPTDINASELYPFGKGNRDIIAKRLKITAVTTADTATAAVLGFAKLIATYPAYDFTNGQECLLPVDPVNNRLVAGANLSSSDIYITVIGTPTNR
jgi:hypothetical protein